MIRKSETFAAIVRLVMFGGCWWWWDCSGLWGDDEFHRYVQRTDRITMSGGDAKEVNAVTHMLTPWPRGVSDRRIESDSTHMQHALERSMSDDDWSAWAATAEVFLPRPFVVRYWQRVSRTFEPGFRGFVDETIRDCASSERA